MSIPQWPKNLAQKFENLITIGSPIAVPMNDKDPKSLYFLNIGKKESPSGVRDNKAYAKSEFALCALKTTYEIPVAFVKKVAMVFTAYHFLFGDSEGSFSDKAVAWVKDLARVLILPFAWPVLIVTALFAAIYPSVGFRNAVATLEAALLENKNYDKLRAMTLDEAKTYTGIPSVAVQPGNEVEMAQLAQKLFPKKELGELKETLSQSQSSASSQTISSATSSIPLKTPSFTEISSPEEPWDDDTTDAIDTAVPGEYVRPSTTSVPVESASSATTITTSVPVLTSTAQKAVKRAAAAEKWAKFDKSKLMTPAQPSASSSASSSSTVASTASKPTSDDDLDLDYDTFEEYAVAPMKDKPVILPSTQASSSASLSSTVVTTPSKPQAQLLPAPDFSKTLGFDTLKKFEKSDVLTQAARFFSEYGSEEESIADGDPKSFFANQCSARVQLWILYALAVSKHPNPNVENFVISVEGKRVDIIQSCLNVMQPSISSLDSLAGTKENGAKAFVIVEPDIPAIAKLIDQDLRAQIEKDQTQSTA